PRRGERGADVLRAGCDALRVDAAAARSPGGVTKGVHVKRAERASRPITIFGAGITGLTAAHELVMRGFTVQIIDKDFNEEFVPRHVVEDSQMLDHGVGGMARSQWAVVAGSSDLNGS